MLIPLLLTAALAPQDVVQASARFEPLAAAAGEPVVLHVELAIQPGWHVYHPDQDESLGIPVSVEVPEGFSAAGDLKAAEPIVHVEEIGDEVYEFRWLEGVTTLELPLQVADGAAGQNKVVVSVRYQACDDSVCLPESTASPVAKFERRGGGADAAAAAARPAGGGFQNLAGQAGFGKARPKVRARGRFTAAAGAGKETELVLDVEVDAGWHVYHPDQDRQQGLPIEFELPAGFELRGLPAIDQKPVVHREEIGDLVIETLWLAGSFEMKQRVKVTEGEPGEVEVPVVVGYQTCDESTCDLPASITVPVSFDRLGPGEGGVTISREHFEIGAGSILDGGLWAFMGAAMVAAFFALLTPCVFPMIPITVSFFTKRAEQGKGSPMGNATFYGLGIMTTFVGLGLGVTAVVGAGGANTIASSPILNLALTALFLWFAFSLFGFYEIQPPAFLQQKLNKLTASGQQKSGYFPVMLMAVAFSVTAFTCTVGFVGAVLALAATSGQWLYATIGMTVFAAVFAAPFFFLALFPSMLQKVPKAGGWMNAVKVCLGFIEMIFAWKFLSNFDMVLDLKILTRPVIIVMTGIPLVLMAAYLFGLYRMPHNHERPKPTVGRSGVGVFALLFGIYTFLGLRSGSFWGAYEAFFPPWHYGTRQIDVVEAPPGSSLEAGPARMAWYREYEEAYAEAKATGQPLFVNFTGVTCVNCRRMEGNIMPHETVRPLLERFVRADLYVDKEPYGEANRQVQIERYQTLQQPLYVIIDPQTDSTIAMFTGYKPNPELFAAFLRKGLEG